MSKSRAYLWVWLIALGQGYFVTAISQAVIPNLVLIAVFSIALRHDRLSSARLAVWGGFWLDVISNVNFGFRILWFWGLSYLVNWLKRVGFRENQGAFIFVALFGFSLLYNFSVWLLLWAGSGRLIPLSNFGMRWLAEALLTAVIGVVSTIRLKHRPQILKGFHGA